MDTILRLLHWPADSQTKLEQVRNLEQMHETFPGSDVEPDSPRPRSLASGWRRELAERIEVCFFLL